MELNWVIRFCRGKGFRTLLFKLVLAAGVYHIWMERNSRVFGGRPRSSDDVFSGINDNIRLRVCIWKLFPNSLENQRLCSQ